MNAKIKEDDEKWGRHKEIRPEDDINCLRSYQAYQKFLDEDEKKEDEDFFANFFDKTDRKKVGLNHL